MSDFNHNGGFTSGFIATPTMTDIIRLGQEIERLKGANNSWAEVVVGLTKRIEELEKLLRTHRHGYRWEPVGNDGMPMCPTPNVV